MELVYGALLLHSTGQKITEENMKKVMQAAGAKPDDARIKALIASLEGADIDSIISKAAMPVAAAPAAEAKEEKKEEEKEEDEAKRAETATEGLSSLFG